jgi:hypothetical protein
VPHEASVVLAQKAAEEVAATIQIANPSGVKIKAVYDQSQKPLAAYGAQVKFNQSLAHAVVTKAKFGASTKDTDPAFLLAMGKQALSCGAARCDQCAAAVIHKVFQSKDFVYHAETVFVGDHHFAVFGRYPMSNVTQPAQWGDGFIVDVWRWKQGMEPSPVITNVASSVYFNSHRAQFKVSCFFRNPHLIGRAATTDSHPALKAL